MTAYMDQNKVGYTELLYAHCAYKLHPTCTCYVVMCVEYIPLVIRFYTNQTT